MGGGDHGGLRLADHVNAVVVAHAFLGGGDEALGFVCPEDDQVVALAFFLRFVEATQRVRIKQHFEEGVDVTALGLELLRHGDADDLAPVDLGEVEGVRGGAEDLRDVGCDERLEIVGNRLFHAADLLGRLIQEAVAEVADQFEPSRGCRAGVEVVEGFLQIAFVNEEMVGVLQRHVGADLAEDLESARDVDLRLVLEKALVARLPRLEAVSMTAFANVL